MSRAWPLFVVAGCVSCASVIGIPNDTASFCTTHTGHTYCEDFDLGDPISRMSYHTTTPGAQLTLAPSDDSPPNLLDLKAPGAGPRNTSLAGYDKEFTSSGFGAVHIEADLRVLTRNGGAFTGQAGFMIITDKQGGCIGLAMTPGGIGAVTFDNPYGCGSLVSQGPGGADAGAGRMDGGQTDGGQADGGGMSTIGLGGLPAMNQWLHMKADVVPSAAHDGSGTFTMDFVGQLTSYQPLMIPPRSLNPVGSPLIGFSAAGLPGSSEVEFQFDNITIDLTPP